MDGNRRWAKSKNLPVIAGHREGVEALKKVTKFCLDNDVEHLTVYAFSTENWKRNSSELEFLFKLLAEVALRELAELRELGVKVDFLGDISKFDKFNIQENLNLLAQETKANVKLNLHIALNYGSVSEITQAVNSLSSADFTQEEFERELYSSSIPNPELLIRTGGEKRLSNFLLWQVANSELIFTETLWPDFGLEELAAIINNYLLLEPVSA
jgi:undecaprenyl diphosphate synthase